MKVLRKRKLLWQIFSSFLIMTLTLLLLVTWYASSQFRDFQLDQTRFDLESSAWLACPPITDLLVRNQMAAIDQYCKQVEGKWRNNRITVILPDGKVVGDSDYDIASMESHRTRPEIQDAFIGQTGISQRFSDTLQQDMMYVAVSVKTDQEIVAVVRMSRSLETVEETLSSFHRKIAVAWLVSGLLAAWVILRFSRRFTAPFEKLHQEALLVIKGDLKRVPESGSVEVGGLSDAMNEMITRLNDRNTTISQQRNEVEAIFSSMSEAIMAVGPEGKILNLNDTMARMFSIDIRSRGQQVQEVIRNKELNLFVERALEHGEMVTGNLTVFMPEPRFLRGHGTRLRDAHGRVLGAVLVFNDVTRLRTLEEHRRQFAANVSHELRTPITSIKGFVETLLGGAIEEKEVATRFLNIIARQSERLGQIIEDLLSLSKIESGHSSIKQQLVSKPLHGELNRALELLREKAREQDVTLSLKCPDDLVAMVHPNLFQQAVVNLIENALKYGGGGKPVRVEACKNGEGVEVRVIDQGPGIARSHLPRLFERFYRVDKGRNRDVGGTGLGLSIVKHILVCHGGKVGVESELGKGSTFIMYLPGTVPETSFEDDFFPA